MASRDRPEVNPATAAAMLLLCYCWCCAAGCCDWWWWWWWWWIASCLNSHTCDAALVTQGAALFEGVADVSMGHSQHKGHHSPQSCCQGDCVLHGASTGQRLAEGRRAWTLVHMCRCSAHRRNRRHRFRVTCHVPCPGAQEQNCGTPHVQQPKETWRTGAGSGPRPHTNNSRTIAGTAAAEGAVR